MNDDQVMHAMSIDDAYRVSRVLAEGAAGVTELVTIDGAGPFVRKRIPAAQARRAVWAALADCHCDRLPQVRATYETPDEFVVVCDYAAGPTLEEVVSKRGRMPLDEAARMAADVCVAAAALHARGVVHGDIAPGNVVLANDGARLIDLGNARIMATERASAGVPDPDQGHFGTWGFAAPEQYGFAQADVRSDLYAIGRTLAFALAGVHPDEEGFAVAMADAAVVPPALRAVIGRACAFEPSARYQTALELSDALVAAMAEADAAGSGTLAQTGVRCAAPGADPADNVPVGGDPALAAAGSPSSEGPSARRAAAGTAASQPCAPGGKAPLSRVRVLIALAIVAVLIVGAAAAWLAFNGSTGSALASAKGTADAAANAADTHEDVLAELLDAADVDFSGPGRQDQAPTVQLELTETGWSAEGGYVMYAFGLRNPSADMRVDFPAVTITGRSADGSVLFSDDQVLVAAYPGATTYFGGQAGNGTEPATVEFTVHEPELYNIHTQEGAGTSFAVGNTALVPDGFGGLTCTGEVALADGSAWDDSLAASGMVAVSVVLRNDAGDLVYGSSTFVDAPQEGREASFQVPLYNVPDYATYEVYAQIW